jgi:hypothetical protein
MNLITNPVANITGRGRAGREKKMFWCFEPGKEMGGQTARRKEGCTCAALSVTQRLRSVLTLVPRFTIDQPPLRLGSRSLQGKQGRHILTYSDFVTAT